MSTKLVLIDAFPGECENCYLCCFSLGGGCFKFYYPSYLPVKILVGYAATYVNKMLNVVFFFVFFLKTLKWVNYISAKKHHLKNGEEEKRKNKTSNKNRLQILL